MIKHLKWVVFDLFIAILMFIFTHIPLYFSMFVFANLYLAQSVFKDEAIGKDLKLGLLLVINIIGWGCELFFDLKREYLSFDLIITLICILEFFVQIFLHRIKN